MSTAEFDRHVANQPDTVQSLLETLEPLALDPDRPLVLSGIGTSLHACRVAAHWVRALSKGRLRPAAIDSHDLSLNETLRPEDQVVVVSHRGTKRFPNEVLRTAAQAGAATVAVTGQGEHEPEAADIVRTCGQERAGTHAESYTAALTALGLLVTAMLGDEGRPLASALAAVPEAQRRTLDLPLSREAVETVADSAGPVLLAGTGSDAITAAEAALKLKEGTYRWTEAVHTEFALHGTPAVFRADTPALLLDAPGPDGGRGAELAGLLRGLGAPVFRAGEREDADLPSAAVPPLARPLVAILPFHRLVSQVAARVGSSPDHIHTDVEPWRSAMGGVAL